MNRTVYIKKENAVHASIICEDFQFLLRLRNAFKFQPEGYQFVPSYKMKKWDGWFHLLKEDGLIYAGLWRDVYDFCKSNNHPVEVDPKFAPSVLPLERFKGFIDRLLIHSDGAPIPPYQYQIDAAHHALVNRSCLLLSPTSSGKSLIQYIIVRTLETMNPDSNTLIVVPTVGLVTQMTEDFSDYSSEIEWDADLMIHGIMSGVNKETDKKIVISTFQSIAKQPESFFFEFDNVMVDECHRSVSKSLIRILEKCVNAEYRVGLTGTLDDCEIHELMLKGLFGPVKTVITTHELMEQDKVAQLAVGMLRFNHSENDRKFLRRAPRGPIDPETDKQHSSKANYTEEIDFLIHHKERNKKIVDLASSLNGNTILMLNRHEHIKEIKELLKDSGKIIYEYHGKVSKKAREKIRKDVEKQDGVIILGTLDSLSTGISIKRLKNLIIAHPTKAKIKTLQSVGRILRKSKFGNNVNLYDIVDDFRIGVYENYTYKHGMKRIEYYSGQRFNIFYKEIRINKRE